MSEDQDSHEPDTLEGPDLTNPVDPSGLDHKGPWPTWKDVLILALVLAGLVYVLKDVLRSLW